MPRTVWRLFETVFIRLHPFTRFLGDTLDLPIGSVRTVQMVFSKSSRTLRPRNKGTHLPKVGFGKNKLHLFPKSCLRSIYVTICLSYGKAGVHFRVCNRGSPFSKGRFPPPSGGQRSSLESVSGLDRFRKPISAVLSRALDPISGVWMTTANGCTLRRGTTHCAPLGPYWKFLDLKSGPCTIFS